MRDRASQRHPPDELRRAAFFLIGPVVGAISFGIAYAAGASLWVAIAAGVGLGGVLQPVAGRLLLPEIARQLHREGETKPRYLGMFHDRGTGEWRRRRTGRPQSWPH